MLKKNKDIKKVEIPNLLKEINDPPKQLFLRGELPDQYQFVYLTIVGSRKYTDYGKNVCENLIKGLSTYPVVIVSGLALGMDSIAHRAALENNLKTIAIPGSGISNKVLYPATNLSLADKILENGGAILSEYEPDFKATNWSFPRRNRIMAGISKASLIIEAKEKSGSLITANLAMDYNRDVFAVPGSIFSDNSKGTNELIKDGVTPITSPNDLLYELGLKEFGLESKQSILPMENLSDNEKIILDILTEPLSKDEIIRTSKLATIEVNILITQLEMKGLIKENFGEIIKIF